MGSGRAAAPRLCRSRWQESVRLSRRRVEGRGWDRAGRGWTRQREEQAPGPGVGSDARPCSHVPGTGPGAQRPLSTPRGSRPMGPWEVPCASPPPRSDVVSPGAPALLPRQWPAVSRAGVSSELHLLRPEQTRAGVALGRPRLLLPRARCSPAPAACCRRLRPVSCSGARGHGGAKAAPSPPRSFRRAQAAARVLSRCSPRGSIGRFLCLPDQMLHLWHRQRLLRHGAARLRNAHLAGAQLGQLPVSARPPAPRPARAQAPRQAGERGARPLPFAWPASRAAA